MLSAIPLLVASSGVATSQTVINDQLQLGDVISEGTLNVVDQTDDTTAVTTATGNGLSGNVVSGSLNVQSTQDMRGAALSDTRINAGSNAGLNTNSTTATTGNTVDAGISGGGILSGDYVQTTSGAGLTSHLQITGDFARTGTMDTSTQTIANSVGFGATDSQIDAAVRQTSSADIQANGGVIFQYVSDSAILAASAVANNVTSTTAGTVTQRLSATQSNTSSIVQASQWAAWGTSQDTVTSATSTANNANLTNTGGSLDTITNQTNAAYVRAQAEETTFSYGGATTTAYGVGNSSLSGNIGSSVAIDSTQTNGGTGIQSIANFTGDNGYDAQVSSTAIGNASSGYACSTCQTTMTVRNTQTNSVDIGASATATVNTSGRSTRATTTAIGNTGSFYVTRPGP